MYTRTKSKIRIFFVFHAFMYIVGCNQTAQAPAPVPVANSSAVPGVTAASFRLPDGAGCSGEVARFRAIMANDLETGHTTKPVFDRVNAEIDQAASACSSGRDGEATRMVRATRTKFGYP
jgi:hypothetical protein